MIQYIKQVMNPSRYHGYGKRAPFFEGWYYKIVSADEQHIYAIIPGVFIHEDPQQTHAFIQFLNGTTGKSTYHTYGSFESAPDDFRVRVGASHFSHHDIKLAIEDEHATITGELTFEGITPWPITLTQPGVMGWYGWLPNMECNHGVLSFDHTITGTLEIDGEAVNFDGGRGYIEKDWGQAFPKGYIWMQSNHFDTAGTSLTASIATIPQWGRTFAGFIVGLWHQGHLYKFTTYNNSRVDFLEVGDNALTWTLYNKHHGLHIEAQRTEGGILKAPQRTDMHRRIEETMRATATVTLLAHDGFRQKQLFHESARNLSLEVSGDLSLLLKNKTP